MKFKTDLITYEGIYRTIETEKLNLPTSEGRRTILATLTPPPVDPADAPKTMRSRMIHLQTIGQWLKSAV